MKWQCVASKWLYFCYNRSRNCKIVNGYVLVVGELNDLVWISNSAASERATCKISHSGVAVACISTDITPCNVRPDHYIHRNDSNLWRHQALPSRSLGARRPLCCDVLCLSRTNTMYPTAALMLLLMMMMTNSSLAVSKDYFLASTSPSSG